MSLSQPDDQDIIIIGATGDLAKRKLLPALYNLYVDGLLPPKGQIIGYTRTVFDDAGLRDEAKTAVTNFSRRHLDEATWPGFSERLSFVSGKDEGLAALKRHCKHSSRIVYLSIPPSAFEETIRGLKEADLVQGTRLVIEKPFGHDLASARELNQTIQAVFDESQVFRIDHYLGKETVQNILVFRFANSVFERVWNRDAIDHIQFTVAEAVGIEGRGAFYEETGAMRDILQNHVFQVLALLTMEGPGSFEAEHVRDEKAKLFRAMRPLRREDVIRGQYARTTKDGIVSPGYVDEPGVAADSKTETYAAVKLWIDNWRWAGVPFYLRTGKRLPIRHTEAVIQFKDVPVPFFHSAGVKGIVPNQLVISIQPEESISFNFMAKAPGVDVDVEPVTMSFSYANSFPVQPAEAYERLLHDVMDGDHTLFARTDSVDRSWEVVEPVLHGDPLPVYPYAPGSWGPVEAEKLVEPDAWEGAMTRELLVVDDPAATAAGRFLAAGPKTIALAGGSTPKALYALLAQQPYDWDDVDVFFGDERCVPPDDPDSNFRMADEALLSRISARVHRMPGETCGAADYDAELTSVFGQEIPQFDLIFLGLGPDGHTASLFPGDDAALNELSKRVLAAERPDHSRLTLTLPVLNAAKLVIFLVAGAEKGKALRQLMDDGDIPAAQVRAEKVVVIADRAAGFAAATA